METSITFLKFLDVFREKNILFFSPVDLEKIFAIRSQNTLKHLLRRLKKDGIIERLTRNKYLFLHGNRQPPDFEIANFLVNPSYVSLESALSFYGILSQFPYRISSITVEKPREVKVREKIFVYSQIKKEYFKDFIKIDNFLIASREKAIFDYFYLVYKGGRPRTTLDEILPVLDNKETKKYIRENADNKFISFIKAYAR